MSRIGRSFTFLVLVHKRWKAFAADAADAFLQGMNVEDLGIDIFTDPVGDVRKRLQTPQEFGGGRGAENVKVRFRRCPCSPFVV